MPEDKRSPTLIVLRIEPLEARIAPAAAVLELSSLNGTDGFQFSGVAAGDQAGFSVSAAGDFNGDGFGDLIVGAPDADPNGSGSGASYVVFGKANGFIANLNLSTLDGGNGFKLSGVAANDRSGVSVSAAGDVNGDGFGDLIIGANGTDPNGDSSGASYVVFGQAGGFAANLNLSTLGGSNGFQINGEAAGDSSGYSVSAAGDVNGDGFGDLIIGAKGTDPNGDSSGASYVVFGKAGGFAANLNLSTLDGSNGFQIDGEAEDDFSGFSVSGAGDVNGDGFADLIIGAPGPTRPVPTGAGTSYVVFGKARGFAANLNLSALDGTNGFKINGEAIADAFGYSVSGAGDINGDGFADLITGAFGVDPNGSYSGASYVIFGKAGAFAASVNLSALDGTNGFKIRGVTAGDYSGGSVSGVDDFNDDGFGDLIVGAYGADSNGSKSGASYLVFGKAGGFVANLNLSALDGSNGFQIRGEGGNDFSGYSVSGAGDINGDGFADLIVGAPSANPNGSDSGASYVIFGAPVFVSESGKTAIFADADGDRVTVTLNKGALSAANFIFSTDGTLQMIDLRQGNFTGANITVRAQSNNGGDGLVNVGAIDATDLQLGRVTVTGDLGQIDIGAGAKALNSLTVGSLGALGAATQAAGVVDPLLSEIAGKVGKLTVQRDVKDAIVEVSGKLGKVLIGGSLVDSGLPAQPARASSSIGVFNNGGIPPVGASHAGTIFAPNIGPVTIMGDINGGEITAEAAIQSVKIVGRLMSLDPLDPAILRAGTGINKVVINDDVQNALILAGYNRSLQPRNPDASIGKVVVNGDWTASSVVAGVADPTDNGFGIGDTLIAGDATPSLLSRIASVVIKGTASGSATASDQSAVTAQKIGALRISGEKVPLTGGPDNLLLDAVRQNFRAVEI